MKTEELVLTTSYGKIVTTSLIIAEGSGQPHKDVLRDIANLKFSKKFTQLNFQPISYLDEHARLQLVYQISHTGFVYIMAKYTSQKAFTFLGKLSKEFDRQEQIIEERNKVILEEEENLAVQRAMDYLSRINKNRTYEVISEQNVELITQRVKDYLIKSIKNISYEAS